jgi:uncharacterized protein
VYLARNATEAVLRALEWSPVVLIEGPRQAGKSVLARDLVGAQRSAAYVTLDDALVLAAARENPQDFILDLPDPVVIDEVQRAPEIFLPIKLSVDRDRRAGRFTLTGSADVLLLPRIADSLAGRMRIVPLLPLSQGEIDGVKGRFAEMIFADGPLPHFEGVESRRGIVERIVRGGFPEAATIPDAVAHAEWMRDYATTLLERDVRDVGAVGDSSALARLLRILASRSGTVLNVSDLSRATGIARVTMGRYLALFARTFAVRMVPAWAGDVGRRLVKSPKLLFVDSGLAANLAGVEAERMLDNPDNLGALLETFVGGELIKEIASSRERIDLMHYRDSRGSEVDWVLEDSQGRLVGIEVKSSGSPSGREFKGLRAFAETVGERFHRGVVLHTGTTAVPMGDKMWALPVEALWRLGAEA